MELPAALRSLTIDNKSTVRTTVLVVLLCNLVLILLSKPQTQPAAPQSDGTNDEIEIEIGFEPVTFFASRIATMLSAYLAAMVFIGHPSLEDLCLQVRETWRRPAVTLVVIELFMTAAASVVFFLAAVTKVVGGFVQETAFFSGTVAILTVVGPSIFTYSDAVVCKMGLVGSVMEGEEWRGMEALRRGDEILKGMKLRGLGLMVVVTLIELATSAFFGLEEGGGWRVRSLIVSGTAQFVVKFLTQFAYTMFYNECKKRNGASPMVMVSKEKIQ